MGDRYDHLRFDRILRDYGIIELGEYDCSEVHDRMDRDMREYGGPRYHQERDPLHTEEGIRRWIRDGRDSFFDGFLSGYLKGITLGAVDRTFDVWGHKLSDFVRVCLGHIVLDKYWAKYYDELETGEKTPEGVMELAFRNFCERGYDTKRFRR